MARFEDKVHALAKDRTAEFLQASLSELLEMAIEDLQAAERNPKYVINMLDWHMPQVDGACSVCLGGAALASRVGIDPSETWIVQSVVFGGSSYEKAISKRLLALNALRTGAVGDAVAFMALNECGREEMARSLRCSFSPPSHPCSRQVEHYSRDSGAFYRDMGKLVADLRAEGL